MRSDAEFIYTHAIQANRPNTAVEEALRHFAPPAGRLLVLAIGKAAYQMAKTADEILGDRIDCGLVITKYKHCEAPLPHFQLREAGHPVPDENSLSATREALTMTQQLTEQDCVLFLVSGGGSALFEDVDCTLDELQQITKQLLASGASISEINTIRKHLSNVKGGRFAAHCAPAKVHAIVLSDVLGDPLDMIASGPACADTSTVVHVNHIIEKYNLSIPAPIISLLQRETPKQVTNSEHLIQGSVAGLCRATAFAAEQRGYRPIFLTDLLSCEAAEAGRFLAAIACANRNAAEPIAFIAGGETVVHLRGNGLGGRNQELALAAAELLNGYSNIAVFSVGSDGTDGPTDAAGGYADGDSWRCIAAKGMDPAVALANNDAYHALALCDGLIFTGPTGTNVNDVAVVLIQPNTQ